MKEIDGLKREIKRIKIIILVKYISFWPISPNINVLFNKIFRSKIFEYK
jgi:hypothetical protein